MRETAIIHLLYFFRDFDSFIIFKYHFKFTRMRFLFVVVIVFSYTQNFGQGYELRFDVKDWKETTVYLGHYYGETTYLSDTAQSNMKGEFVFQGQKPLNYRGFYFVAISNSGNVTAQFHFIIGDNQRFKLITYGDDFVKNMKVVGDDDNSLFFENVRFSAQKHREADPYLKVLRDSSTSKLKRKNANNAYEKISKTVIEYQNDIVKLYPKTLTAKIIKAYQPVQVPDVLTEAKETANETFRFRHYREHFFDNFDLAEPGLLCLPQPLYKNKLDEYLDKLHVAKPDSIVSAIDKVIAVAKNNKETYKYAIRLVLFKYQQPEIMGLDEVFVSLYDKYIASGEMNFWLDQKTKNNLKEHAERLRKSLVGKLGENLIMQDANLKPCSMSDISNKYTVLYVFDPDCGHCREETPELVTFYNSKKFDIGVYAVCADSSIQKMKSYIKEMKMTWTTVNAHRTYTKWYQDLYDAITTPSLYVLDRNRRIIAKKIPVDKLGDFLTQYEKLDSLRLNR